MHHLFQILAGVIGIFGYILLIFKLLKEKKEQSFASFILWAMLDAIATVTVILKDGNYWLPLSNVLGAGAITLILAVKKQFSWSLTETITAILVFICLIVWRTAGTTVAIIASSLAMVVASIPQMRDTYKKPGATPLGVYVIFLGANIVSFIAGKSWTIKERFYPGCAVFLCAVIVLFSLRRYTTSFKSMTKA